MHPMVTPLYVITFWPFWKSEVFGTVLNAFFRRLRRFGSINRTIICCVTLIYSCLLKCAYLVTSCTICFLLSIGLSVLTCVLEDAIFSCLIIVLHWIKDPLSFVRCLTLFNIVLNHWLLVYYYVIVVLYACRIDIKGYWLNYFCVVRVHGHGVPHILDKIYAPGVL